MLTRRQAMKAGAGAIAATAAVGAASAETDDEDVNFSSSYADDPYIVGTIEVEEQTSDMTELQYVADDGNIKSLPDEGVVLASGEEDSPHNPVTIQAADIEASEFVAFPRGTQYDESGDGDAETDVEWHDPTHWTTSNATNGSISLSEVEGNGMSVSSSSLADGETVSATFDLSSVGSSDATITDGMSRRFLQVVRDINALPSAVTVDYALVDSAGNEVVASDDPSGDTSTVDVLHASTADSVVDEVRVGELESSQSATLDDIQKVEIRISASGSAADGDVTLHALNAEKSEEWDFGTEEYTDEDGNVDTQTVREPVGDFGVTGLDTLPDYFSSGTIHNVTLDVELRASEVPDEESWVRVEDAPESYAEPNAVETVFEFTWPSAYAISVTSEAIENVQALPSGNYLRLSHAVGINDIEDWEDIEDTVSWTDDSGSLGSVDDTLVLKSSTASGDRMAVRIRRVLSEKGTDSLLSSGSGGAAVVGGSGGGSGGLLTIFGGIATALAVWKREAISALFG